MLVIYYLHYHANIYKTSKYLVVHLLLVKHIKAIDEKTSEFTFVYLKCLGNLETTVWL